ncbi:MAG TPA: M23 family metallopeptidase [Burkholderiales bacterium]|nr:M23 family metallopeptidase [Burkholderiales bacterium]
MSAFESDRAQRKFPIIGVLFLIVVIVLAGGGYYLAPRFERSAPQVKLPDSDVLGLSSMDIAVHDAGAGLKSVSATLSAGGTDYPLLSEQFAQPASGKKFSLATSKLSGLKEGPAVLRVTARDASLWNWFRGNETVIQKNLTIDVTPPTVELIADDRYVNFGGVGVIVYKASADTATSGVKLGNYFFPGYKGQIKDQPDAYIALFAHAYNVPADAKAQLVATDKAGNSRQIPVVYELKNVNYKKSTIALSDNFLQNKVVPLLTDVAARQGSPKDIFVAVNKKLRADNEKKIMEVTSKGTPTMLWSGAFAQLSNSKVEANFADQRTYVYNGEPVDTAYHLGYDLSVTKHYPIEAANSGTVVYAEPLGIYGNCVILDHGLGLFTLYGHLSSFDVKVGDTVKQRQILGKTGETGLAAGDHLHYGVYLNGVAVLPVEWWDQKWITDNLTPKLAGKSSEAVAESQRSARAGKGTKRRR